MFKINTSAKPAVSVFRRFNSSTSNKSLAKILVFPVTSQKSFLLFRYNKSLINSDSLLVRYENKAVSLATKGWNTLNNSDKSYNKKIVYYVTKFLDRIPWIEDSLRSIPSSSALLRELKTTDSKEFHDEKRLVSSLELQTGEHKEQLVDIPIYYPSSILSKDTLQQQIKETIETGLSYHKKQMILTAIMVPLTLPIALVPVVPNVPCFYFAYRFYCNFKAYLGVQHLQQLTEENHLIFKDNDKLNHIYKDIDNDNTLKINEEIIEEISEEYDDVKSIKGSLEKTLHQESDKLEKKDD